MLFPLPVSDKVSVFHDQIPGRDNG